MNAAPGTEVTLRSLPYDKGDGIPSKAPRNLLSLRYRHEAPMSSAPFPTTLREVPALSTQGAENRLIVFDDMTINGKPFDHHRVDIRAPLGATEVWSVRNDDVTDHPFHLHGFSFQVLDRGGIPEPFRAWKDTVNVRPGETVRFAVKFERFPGLRMFHCHILQHEDMGMMGLLLVE